jgi:hypothetical protein
MLIQACKNNQFLNRGFQFITIAQQQPASWNNMSQVLSVSGLQILSSS